MSETTTVDPIVNALRKALSSFFANIRSIKSTVVTSFRIAIEAIKPQVVVEKLRKAYAPPFDQETLSLTAVNKKHVDWPQVVVTFCFGGGIGFSFVSAEIRCQAPISFDLLSLLTALAFSFVFISNFIREKHPVSAGVLEFIGVLFAAAGLFTALCIPLPPMFKCVVWVIFAGSVLSVSIVNISD